MKSILIMTASLFTLPSFADYPCRETAKEAAKGYCSKRFSGCDLKKTTKVGVAQIESKSLARYTVDFEWESGDGYGDVGYDIIVAYNPSEKGNKSCVVVEFK